MKFSAKIMLIVSLAVTFAHTQSNNLPHVRHVIVVIQENRTPDNLFQQDQILINRGAHIVSQGSCGHGSFALQPESLHVCWDTDHSHRMWINMWAEGAMTGACRVGLYTAHCNQLPTCPDPNFAACPSLNYVENSIWQTVPLHRILDPYFQIANQYGWANYMFQTNQGPSFPAHLFLFSGTSAPIQYNDPNDPCGTYPCWQWFDEENVARIGATSGCTASAGRVAMLIDPTSHESLPPNPLGFPAGYPCYDHPAISDLLETAQPKPVTWKYYGRGPADLWTAPSALNHICGTDGGGNGGTCRNAAWQNNVGAVLPNMGHYKGDAAPVLTDIANCKLPQVSWVIPDGNWSDHSGFTAPGDAGPSWVAAIVNAVGQDTKCENGAGYWSDTTILITWDDWGGLYDDVAPPDCPGPGPCTGYANRTGGQYVYGFRVPLLVVSAYAKPSYISGPASNPQCAGNNYCHDFGSILNFIEYAFGSGGRSLGAPYGIGPQQYPYADYFALDAPPNCTTCTYSLSDFFNFKQSKRKFKAITGAKYPPSCFHTPKAQGCFSTYPVDADNDAEETD